MIGFVPIARRSRRAVEVLQSSLTDCGPAALKSVLEGFGIEASYDLLRQRCQTDVDGTSIDALAALGCELGLDSRQVLVPHDHFLLPEARCLPAIVVTRSPGGLLHFVVVWRKLGAWVEVMDPGSGRRWVDSRRLLAEMPVLPLPISRRRFREWAGSEAAHRPWRARARALGLSTRKARELLDAAGRDASWIGFACFDAALRMTAALVAGGAVAKGRQAARTLELLGSKDNPIGIPERYRWIRPSANELTAHGSVIVNFLGRKPRALHGARLAPAPAAPTAGGNDAGPTSTDEAFAPAAHPTLPAGANARLAARDWHPLGVAWQLLRVGRAGTLCALLAALCLSAALVPIETFVLRALLDMGRYFALTYQKLGWLAAALLLTGSALLVDIWCGRVLASLGRELEARVRAALLERLPRLPDEYLRSRSSADMASRGHSLHVLRALPILWAQLARAALSVVTLTSTLIWLYADAWRTSLLLALAALAVPFFGRRALSELSLRLRARSSALDRFYLDTLLGQAPVRVHGAELAVRTEHEQLLTEWAATTRQLHRRQTALQAVQACVTLGIGLALVLQYLHATAETTRLLLLTYFALRLPASAGELTSAEFSLRNLRTVALRALAPLAAPLDAPHARTESGPASALGELSSPERRAPGVAVSLSDVTVLAGGHALLSEVSLELAPGEHVAIVGASGAGKSSLVALLLGFHRPARGSVRIDGESLDAERTRTLRREIAWVDPAVQLWDRTLLENLTFGDDDGGESLAHALSGADLLDVLERLPEGLQSNLGEGGVCVSGGQGQRVRLGRALMRRNARLVLLDEPFRGLERERRRELLARTRRHFQAATLVFVSHDVEHTSELDRVLVVDAGQIVEQGVPGVLLRDPESRYARLMQSSRALHGELWGAPFWRRLDVRQRRVGESPPTAPESAMTVNAPGGTMTLDGQGLTWPAEALGSAVLDLARALGMEAMGGEPLAAWLELGQRPSADADLAAGLRSAAARAGLGVELADCGYSELERTLETLGPSIIRVELGGEPRYLAVLASTRRGCTVLTPARGRAAVPRAELVDALTSRLRHEAAAPVDAWLRALAVPARRSRRARSKLFTSILEERRLGPFYLLSLDPGTRFGKQLRQRGLLRLVGVLVLLSTAHVALSLASWAVLGRTALSGYVDPGWIAAWLLLQLGAVPFQLAIAWFGGALFSETAVLLKRRLLAGALRIDSDRIRTRGAGRLLAMVFESEALEAAGLAGAFGMLLSAVQLGSAVLVLASGLGGALEVVLLLAWCGCTAWLALRQFRARSVWTRERFALARAFVESVVGNRTRVAQQPEPRWHLQEDRALGAHLAVARDMDHAQTRLMVLPARGWLMIGLAGLVPALALGSHSPAALVIAIGGILQAYGALAALCGSALTIAGAAVAWREVRELFEAAALVGNPGTLRAATERQERPALSAEAPPILDARGLSFQYPGRHEPVLADCNLSLRQGDRVLLEGTSGAGKSTLAALLAGLRRPDSGHISIAGLDRTTLGDAGWRRRITSAPQFHENHILSASFAFNLLMGRSWPPSDADLREAEVVCAGLGLDALLANMPSGMHQAIGETGWQLSHGERSRLFLARALLQDTDVLVLDESFGALDPETLRRCLDLVLERARTLVVIAHP